ncbi:MAG: helicase HerA-like domain-containing protein [Gammaproteobacteria bacterium]
METSQILVGGGDAGHVVLEPRYANRHGLIAGATGTGKTVSLQILAEAFSARGVPVFLADVKGDLAGLSQAGAPHPKIDERVATIGMPPPVLAPSPVVFWDVFGRGGHHLRTTVSEMGPMLLARLLELNDTQEGVLQVVFRYADEEGLLLLDMPDLRALLNHAAEREQEISARYGRITRASIGAIQRRLLALESQGGDSFFGEPALQLADMMRTDLSGRGIINVLDARVLFHSPRVYATCLLWLLAELFEQLPEIGDPPAPKLVFFFDEAHLLFDNAPPALVAKVEQVVRLIRSKGVGVWFVTQSPLDLPDAVLGQLGNRVQHALRAFTPRDQKAVRAAATTFRQNPALDTATAITELGVGEALVSMLEDKGVPGVVQRCLVRPPCSRIGPITDEERTLVRSRSPVGGLYDQAVNRESAYEILSVRAEQAASEAAAEAAARQAEKDAEAAARASRASRPRASSRQGYVEAATKSAVRSMSSQLGRSLGQSLLRGLLGSLSKR